MNQEGNVATEKINMILGYSNKASCLESRNATLF